MDMTNKEYGQYVNAKSKPSPLGRDMLWAFVVGGLICTVGQALLNLYQNAGMGRDDAGSAVSMTLIFAAALLTGLGLFDKLAKRAGAGTLVPITGFANAVASPAIEFKKDGRCIIRIVRETRNRRVSGRNPTYFYWEGGT